MSIPFSKPFFDPSEIEAVRKVILSGWVTRGPVCSEFEAKFAEYVGSKYACSVSNCTAALHVALLAVGVKPGDIVITVSHSFIATANCVRYCGGEPAFIDIDPRTYNMDVAKLEAFLQQDCKIGANGNLYYTKTAEIVSESSPLFFMKPEHTGRIAGILAVHQVGLPCEIVEIKRLADQYKLPLIEDAACGLGSEISLDRGRTWQRIGNPIGDMVCFSFHPRKIITTGDGGMIVTNNEELHAKVTLMRQHGMNLSDAQRHAAETIVQETYDLLGFNYRLTDIQAAVGFEQLKKIDTIIARRRAIGKLYYKLLEKIEWLELPKIAAFAKPNFQSFPVRVLSSAPRSRDELMIHLHKQGIATRFGVMNAHEEKPYLETPFTLTESTKARAETLILPIFHQMTDEDVHLVSNSLL